MLIVDSDVGLRREDREQQLDVTLFGVVVDTGMAGGYIECRSDWRTSAELRDYAARIIAAADWLDGAT